MSILIQLPSLRRLRKRLLNDCARSLCTIWLSLISYEQESDQRVILKLKNDDLIAIFRFENIDSIEIDTHPETDWVYDSYCYRLRNSDFLKFNVDGYTIVCEHAILDEIIDLGSEL